MSDGDHPGFVFDDDGLALEPGRRVMDTGTLDLGVPPLLVPPQASGFQLLAQYVGPAKPLVCSLGLRVFSQLQSTFPLLSSQLYAGVTSAAAPYGGAWFHPNSGCAKIEYGRGADARVLFTDLSCMQFPLGICDWARVSVQRYNPTLTVLSTVYRATAGIHVAEGPTVDEMPWLTAVRFLVTAPIVNESMPIPTRARYYKAWAVNETTAANTGPRWTGLAAANPVYTFTGGGENAILSMNAGVRLPTGDRWEVANAGDLALQYAQLTAAPTTHSLYVRFWMVP